MKISDENQRYQRKLDCSRDISSQKIHFNKSASNWQGKQADKAGRPGQ